MSHSYDITTADRNPERDKDLERKQRAHEYRVAARREKRNRKADEKKQRKLNATILRRMTRNPDKYNKNADRNRLRAIDLERRRIQRLAIRQIQDLAAVHDPSGVLFNVSPVVKLADGGVVTQESIRRREQRLAEKAALEEAQQNGTLENPSDDAKSRPNGVFISNVNGFQQDSTSTRPLVRTISKRQQKKQALFAPRPPPPKPVLPAGIALPSDQEDWLSLWDLPDEELERRVKREKKRKAGDRKALRQKQKSGKAERRAARDEKRAVYRDIKLEWKAIKEEQTKMRTLLKSIEQEESKKIAVLVNEVERKRALELCALLGFTIENTEGTAEIQPKAQGMRGVEVDFDAIEKSEKQGHIQAKSRSKRVDLSAAANEAQVEYIGAGSSGTQAGEDEFLQFEVGEGKDFEELNYNYKLRRKLRRAIDRAEMEKEALVRQRGIEYFESKGQEVPVALRIAPRPINLQGHRILENGKLETDKQERVRKRVELMEFNNFMRVLRRQAKEAAIYAGLKKYAEVTGQIPLDREEGSKMEGVVEMPATAATATASQGLGQEVLDQRKRSRADAEDGNDSSGQNGSPEDMMEDSLGDESDSATSISPGSNSDTGAKKRRKMA